MRLILGRISFWLPLAGILLILGGVISLLSILRPAWSAARVAAEDLPPDPIPTSTPFQPQTRTPILRPIRLSNRTLAVTSTPATPELQPTPAPITHFAQMLTDYPEQKVHLVLYPDQSVNAGQSIEMTFFPAQDCPYGTGTACISQHRSGQVILLTIHSGIGGEAEAFRQAVESTSLYGAGFTGEQIQTNLASLQNIPVQMSLGAGDMSELEMAAVARVPGVDLEQYFELPYDEALEMVARQNEQVRAVIGFRSTAAGI